MMNHYTYKLTDRDTGDSRSIQILSELAISVVEVGRLNQTEADELIFDVDESLAWNPDYANLNELICEIYRIDTYQSHALIKSLELINQSVSCENHTDYISLIASDRYVNLYADKIEISPNASADK